MIINSKIKITESMKNIIEEELDILKNYDITKSTMSIKQEGKTFNIKLILFYKGKEIVLKENASDFYFGLSLLKTKAKDYMNSLNIKKKIFNKNDDMYLYNENVEEEKSRNSVVEIKYCSLKPMSEVEAIMQMNLYNLDSYLFLDNEFNHSMICRKKNGGFLLVKGIN
ncbi:MAG: sigma 54 modulation/S30EA ribosomal C-terminal domain-containing protein [Peptostreptococcaceae bacterium]